MAIPGWTLTRHAKRRRKSMKITEDRIAEVLHQPDWDSPSLQDPSRRWAFRGDLVVVYNPATCEIITVMWKHMAHYISREAANAKFLRDEES